MEGSAGEWKRSCLLKKKNKFKTSHGCIFRKKTRLMTLCHLKQHVIFLSIASSSSPELPLNCRCCVSARFPFISVKHASFCTTRCSWPTSSAAAFSVGGRWQQNLPNKMCSRLSCHASPYSVLFQQTPRAAQTSWASDYDQGLLCDSDFHLPRNCGAQTSHSS